MFLRIKASSIAKVWLRAFTLCSCHYCGEGGTCASSFTRPASTHPASAVFMLAFFARETATRFVTSWATSWALKRKSSD